MLTHDNLKQRVAVITGAAGVLCSQMAKDLAEIGVRVVLLGRTLENLEALADEIQSSGGTALPIQCDVLDVKALQKAREKVLDTFGLCDILINGAGGNSPLGTTTKDTFEMTDLDKSIEEVKTFFDLDPEGISYVFNLNFLGTLLPTQCFAKDMVGRENTCIINISSMNAIRPLTRIPAYSGAKAAVSNLTQFMAVHFADTNIRVNAISPGFFATKQNKALLYNDDGSFTARSEKIISQTPMKRFGTPKELSGALLFLCNEAYSSFVTGVILPIDGGFSAYSGV